MPFLSALLSMVFPRIAPWIADLIAYGIPAAIRLAKEIDGNDAKGEDKAVIVIDALEEHLDQHYDGIPGWTELSEEQRDRIMGGLQELGYLAARAGAKGVAVELVSPLGSATTAKERRASRRAKRKARREERKNRD